MFGSSILEVAIGVIFIYLLLSLICSAINEFIASIVNKRGENLFEGIKSLLAREPGLEVSAVSYGNRKDLLSSLEAGPDTILLNESTRTESMRTSEILRELEPEENLRVIVVRLEDNMLEVYDKQCLKLTNNADLIALLQSR